MYKKKILHSVLMVLVTVFYIGCSSPEIKTLSKTKSNDVEFSKVDSVYENQSLPLIASYFIDTFSTDTFINTVRNTIILRKERGLKNSNYLLNFDSLHIHFQGGFSQDTVLLKINNKTVIDGVYTTSPIKGFAYLTKKPNISFENNNLIVLKINNEKVIKKNIDLKNYKYLLIKKFTNREIVFIVTNKSQNYV